MSVAQQLEQDLKCGLAMDQRILAGVQDDQRPVVREAGLKGLDHARAFAVERRR